MAVLLSAGIAFSPCAPGFHAVYADTGSSVQESERDAEGPSAAAEEKPVQDAEETAQDVEETVQDAESAAGADNEVRGDTADPEAEKDSGENTEDPGETQETLPADEASSPGNTEESSTEEETSDPSEAAEGGNEEEDNAVSEASPSDALFDEDGLLLDGEVIPDDSAELQEEQLLSGTVLQTEIQPPAPQELPEIEMFLPEDTPDITEYVFSGIPDLSPDEMLQKYFEKELGTGDSSLLQQDLLNAPASAYLSGPDLIVYRYVKQEIEKIAAGKRADTRIEIPLSLFVLPHYDASNNSFTVTSKDVGGPLVADGQLTERANNYFNNLVSLTTFDYDAVNYALYHDCPYDLYWTMHFSCTYLPNMQIHLSGNSEQIVVTVTHLPCINLKVDPTYRLDSGTETVADKNKTARASTAASTAKTVVDYGASLTDIEKLQYYLYCICYWNSYNQAAAEYGSSSYGTHNPWEVIYVFDGDPETNVVCEGYSKAFKFLCDLTDFKNSEIECHVATGNVQFSYGSGGGPHAWNVVHLGNGKNYLVDVTHCDSDDGWNYSMFLRGYYVQYEHNGRQTGYLVDKAQGPSSIYTYDDQSLNILTDTELRIAEGNPPDPEEIPKFIKRLYVTCLNRNADTSGLNYWNDLITSGKVKGIRLAGNFVFSNEFTSKNYCNRHYVQQLYSALMGRSADDSGLNYWVGLLDSGTTREAALNSFASSAEYRSLCENAGFMLGEKISVPKYGTQQYGPCSVCGKKSKVVQFVERMYTECLKRNADTSGLAYWSRELCNHTKTGKSLLDNFFLSQEIRNKNLSNEEYVRRIYKAMLNRDPDSGGLAYWTGRLNQGASATTVIAGFVDSTEFRNICADYGIQRK